MATESLTSQLGLSGTISQLQGSTAGIGNSVTVFLVSLLVILAVGGVTFFIFSRKLDKKRYNKSINLFVLSNGKREWIQSFKAREIPLPGSNTKVFLWKNGTWSAYPTRSFGLNVYGYTINRFGELANFDIPEGDDPIRAKAEYDSRDQTYVYLNIQRNLDTQFRKKDVKWWKENMPIIVIVLSGAMLIFAMWFFFARTGKVIDGLTNLVQAMNTLANSLNSAISSLQSLNSGVKVG